jgi:hypothetical protein
MTREEFEKLYPIDDKESKFIWPEDFHKDVLWKGDDIDEMLSLVREYRSDIGQNEEKL